MVYYLDRVDTNKQQIESLEFTPQQLNFMAYMMIQCRPLRQRDVIINLLKCSLPEKFDMELIVKESEDKTRTWKDPFVVLKK